MMTQEKFVEEAKRHLPTGVKSGETNDSIAARLLAEGFISIVAEAQRSGLVKAGTAPVDQHQAIAERAYAISKSPGAGTPIPNWAKAETEIKAGK